MANLVPVHAAREAVVQAMQARAVTIGRRDKLVRDRDAHRTVIAQIEAADHTRAVEALSLDMSPPEMNREDARRLTNSQRALKAAPDVLGIAERDLALADAARDHAKAVFAGAVWTATTEEQAECRDQVEAELAKLGPALARLAAVDLVRERFSTGPIHLAAAGDDRPWSGRALVKTLVNGIPVKLRGDALNIDAILRGSVEIANTMIARIEGKE